MQEEYYVLDGLPCRIRYDENKRPINAVRYNPDRGFIDVDAILTLADGSSITSHVFYSMVNRLMNKKKL